MTRLPLWCLGALVLMLVGGLVLPALAAQTNGMVKTVDKEKNEFVLMDAVDRNWTFSLATTTKVYLNDKEVPLTELRAGDMAVVSYEVRDSNHFLALVVRGKRR